MRILITGICGFVGSALAMRWSETDSSITIYGLDNLSRSGSELNRIRLRKRGVKIFHVDIRAQSDFESLPPVDWVIDAAANPSVLAGVEGPTSSRQLIEHNLIGTLNIIEYCKRHRAGLIVISTSRVYSIKELAKVKLEVADEAFVLQADPSLPEGLMTKGGSERFSTAPPLSLYGSTKLASEVIALEYGETFDFPVWINRCGVLAGAGQFGRADQGIFTFWINSYLRRRSLKYIGFGGKGYQVRDCLHPGDLIPLFQKQVSTTTILQTQTINLGGGLTHAISLARLSSWCRSRFRSHEVSGEINARTFDVPWMVMDYSLAQEIWGWQPQTSLNDILEEIAEHAQQNPEWLQVSSHL